MFTGPQLPGFGNDSFDRDFNRAKRGVATGMGCFGLAFVIQAAISLTIVGLIVAVAWHFIAKVW